MDNNTVRVRFAPSPTGPLHIGGVRTALYNYLFARQHGGQFVFRIEDTDSSRFVPGAEEYIIEAFKWLGIQFDEGVSFGGQYGPYRQSERRDIYKKYVQQLIDNGKAYYAFDTPEELEAKRAEIKNFQYDAHTRMMMRNSLTLGDEQSQQLISDGQQYVVRFKVEPGQAVHVDDLIRGDVRIMSDVVDDKVLYKSADELPTYHLANIVDDHLMRITHVIRGEEWLPSAPLHVMLYQAFGWTDSMPRFAHLPLLLKPEGKGKLSCQNVMVTVLVSPSSPSNGPTQRRARCRRDSARVAISPRLWSTSLLCWDGIRVRNRKCSLSMNWCSCSISTNVRRQVHDSTTRKVSGSTMNTCCASRLKKLPNCSPP